MYHETAISENKGVSDDKGIDAALSGFGKGADRD